MTSRLQVPWPDERLFAARGGRPFRILAVADEVDQTLDSLVHPATAGGRGPGDRLWGPAGRLPAVRHRCLQRSACLRPRQPRCRRRLGHRRRHGAPPPRAPARRTALDRWRRHRGWLQRDPVPRWRRAPGSGLHDLAVRARPRGLACGGPVAAARCCQSATSPRGGSTTARTACTAGRFRSAGSPRGCSRRSGCTVTPPSSPGGWRIAPCAGRGRSSTTRRARS